MNDITSVKKPLSPELQAWDTFREGPSFEGFLNKLGRQTVGVHGLINSIFMMGFHLAHNFQNRVLEWAYTFSMYSALCCLAAVRRRK